MKKLMIYEAPWAPLLCLLSMNFTLCIISSVKTITVGHYYATWLLPVALISLMLTSMLWFRDCFRETIFGVNEDDKLYNTKMGVLLFLLSEAFLFASFFWMFISTVLVPELSFWPPSSLSMPSFIGAPSLNTILLVASSATVTLSHYEKDIKSSYSLFWLCLTLILSGLFLMVQYMEYTTLPFNFTSGVGGSAFYLATGFHGSHVILGSFLLMGCAYLLNKNLYTKNSMLSYELAIWYWHFVDAIWLMLYTIFYCWGH